MTTATATKPASTRRAKSEARSQDGTITCTFEVITPELADEYLTKNLKNRSLSEVLAARYARDMDTKHWLIGTSGIGFTDTGVLIDGQHRLEAIKLSGKPTELPVFRGLKEDARIGIDTGRGRSVRDEMTMRDVPNSSAAAALTRMVMQYEDHAVGMSQQVQYSPTEILEYATTYEGEVQAAVRQAFRVYSTVKVSMSAMGAAYLVCARIDKELAEHYFDKLFEPSNLDSGDPILAVRERLMQQRISRTKMSTPQVLWILLRGWNGLRKGERLRHIKLPPVVTGKHMVEAA